MKTNGFTIAEILIAMIISVLIISATSLTYLFMTKQFYIIDENLDKTSTIISNYELLQARFWECDSALIINQDSLTMYRDDSLSCVASILASGIIISIQGHNDTLLVEDAQIRAKKYGSNEMHVTSFSITGLFQSDPILLYFSKY